MLTLILVCSIVVLTSAYPSGAPLSCCGDMEPNHNGPAQNSYSNIRIEDPGCFIPNQPLKLQISGGSFKGFLVQARENKFSSPLGVFNPTNSDSKAISCRNLSDSITHTSKKIKSLTLFSWTPPMNSPSQVIIRMAVVKDFSTYWLVETYLNICIATTTSKTTPLTTATSAPKASSTKLSTVTKTILKTGAATIKTNIATTENKISSLLYTTASSSRSTRLFFTTLAPAKTTTKTALPITIRNTNSDKVTGYSTGKPVTATYLNKNNTTPVKSTTKSVSRTTSKPSSCRDKANCRRIEAVDCYSKEIQKSCCKTCNGYMAFYGNVADCPYGDKKRNCKNISMKRCFEDNGSNDEDDVVCCYSCKKYIKP